MPVSYWIHNGNPVKFPTSSGKKYDKFIADNGHLVGNEATKAEHDAAKALETARNKRVTRAGAMPTMSDRVDAIFDALAHLRANGETFPASVEDMIDQVEQVKSENPI